MNSDLDGQLQRAVAAHRQGQLTEAAALYLEILQSRPDHADVLHLLGVTETQLGRAHAGLQWITRSLAIEPQQPAAIANRGNALLALAQPLQALACYEQAMSFWPDYPLAAFGRGNALAALRKPADALVSFDRALALAPNFVEALNARGGALVKLNRFDEALASYDRAIELSPAVAQTHLGRGSALLGLKAHREAAQSFERALELAPEFAEALIARGDLKTELGQTDAALADYERALQNSPDNTVAWFGRGLALSLKTRFADAAGSFRRCLALDAGHAFASGMCLHSDLQICDWREYPRAVEDITASMERGAAVDFPFSFLAVCDSPQLQRRCAERFAALQPAPPRSLWNGEHYGHARIRLAYLSADFLEHPTSFLMTGLFEKHDRSRFETIAISLRDEPRSPMAQRVKAACERFIVPGDRSDVGLAMLIRELEIDIAVDLMGYTGEHRAAVFSHRPAPLQVNYLGFPATMGAPFMDYILAGPFLIPEAYRSEYREKVACLPECFQANDDRRIAASDVPRASMGLPDSSFVWCSFHSSYKLNPPVFDVWARLLLATPGSVLWLLGGTPEIEQNLRREALSRGVDPERLVFARPLPYSHHLARLSLADICLDTLPFNGGATTSDALWAGVPVVTCAGRSFAARMSGSLLHTLGLPELVTGSLQEYERLALQLAADPRRLAELRALIAGRKNSSPLFDTDRFRHHIEAAFMAMMRRSRCGLPAASFSVPPLSFRAGQLDSEYV